MPARLLPEDYCGEAELLKPLESALAQVVKAGGNVDVPVNACAGAGAGAGGRVRVAVALSGGADSAMLAVHGALAQRRFPSVELHCFHVHHGLQDMADQWCAHVHQLAHGLGLACHSLRVQVEQRSGKGVEAAARDARYGGFKQLAEHTAVSHILLAHHCNDQAETVVLRLLRGAGPEGLGAMAPTSRRDGLTYVRPWLDVERPLIVAAAHDYGQRTGWAAVLDPTNIDDAYTRGAVRRRLVPVLDERWPAWRTTLSRHARQARDLTTVLDDVAAEDFLRLDPSTDGRDFSLEEWRELSPQRRVLVLRHWLQRHGLRAPSDARMRELCRQLSGLHALGHDRDMRMRHEQTWICCIRGRVRLLQASDIDEKL